MHEVHRTSEKAWKSVVTLRGAERGLCHRAAKTERQGAKKEDRQNEPREEIGHELDLEARSAKSCSDAMGIVAAKMPSVNIFLRPECLQGRDSAVEAAARLEEPLNRSQEGDIVSDVLDDIKGTRSRQAAFREASVLQGRVDDTRDTASRGIEGTTPRLNEHGIDTGILKRQTHKAIASADVIQLSTRRELRDERANAFIAMRKPVAALLDL